MITRVQAREGSAYGRLPRVARPRQGQGLDPPVPHPARSRGSVPHEDEEQRPKPHGCDGRQPPRAGAIGPGLRVLRRRGFVTAQAEARAFRTAIGCAFRRRAIARRDKPSATSARACSTSTWWRRGGRAGAPVPSPVAARPQHDCGSGGESDPVRAQQMMANADSQRGILPVIRAASCAEGMTFGQMASAWRAQPGRLFVRDLRRCSRGEPPPLGMRRMPCAGRHPPQALLRLTTSAAARTSHRSRRTLGTDRW